MNRKTSAVSVVTAAIAAASLALSLDAAAAWQAESGAPTAHTQGDVTYLSGGVGRTEASAIKHLARLYPLELEFLHKARPRDEYLANVKVRIEGEHAKRVLDVTSDGPFLLAKLPAGIYTVSAESGGKVEHRTVEIAPKEHRRVVFEWRS